LLILFKNGKLLFNLRLIKIFFFNLRNKQMIQKSIIRKSIGLVLLLGLVTPLGACNQGGEAPPAQTPEAPTEAPQTPAETPEATPKPEGGN
jgi:hypothetical protein